MKHVYKMIWLPLLFLPFCANKKAELTPSINKQGSVYAVNADVLKITCLRGIGELQAQQPPRARKSNTRQVWKELEPLTRCTNE